MLARAIALLRQPNNRLLVLKATSTTVAASGSLVIVPETKAAMLTIQNLAPSPMVKFIACERSRMVKK